MKRPIPPEIDALMWRLAEEGGPIAQMEFEQRYTRYGPELTRRIRMVAELRQAGKTVAHRPSFTPRPVRTAPTPRWAVGTALGLAALAVGAVAYVVSSGGEQRTPPQVVPRVDTRPAVLPKPNVVFAPPKEEPPTVGPPPTAPPPKAEPPASTRDDKPRDVRIADTNLLAAIQLVAAGGGIKATVAPGFVDQKVTLDYRGLSTLDTLRAMGDQYGFSVLEQEEGHVLVVPARETTPERRIGP